MRYTLGEVLRRRKTPLMESDSELRTQDKQKWCNRKNEVFSNHPVKWRKEIRTKTLRVSHRKYVELPDLDAMPRKTIVLH
ncbi:MAG: hypothetical protein ABI164_12130, partial [Acidobacteriaceae bacterium]